MRVRKLFLCWIALRLWSSIRISWSCKLTTLTLPQFMLLFLKVDWWYFFCCQLYLLDPALPSLHFFTITHVERFFTSNIALISSFWFCLMTSFRKLSFWLFLILEERSTNWIDSLISLHLFSLFSNDRLNVTFLFLLLLCLACQLFLNQFFFFGYWLELIFLLEDRRMITMFHPSMTLVAVHSSRTLWSFNRLNFVLEVPMRTFFRFVMIHQWFSSIILNIMSIGAISSFVTK